MFSSSNFSAAVKSDRTATQHVTSVVHSFDVMKSSVAVDDFMTILTDAVAVFSDGGEEEEKGGEKVITGHLSQSRGLLLLLFILLFGD